jgi:hypothetical protein
MSFRSDDLYRAVATEATVRPANARTSAGAGVIDAKSASTVQGSKVAEARGPQLPVDFAKFPKQPLNAVLKGPYAVCFECVKRAVSDLNIVVESADAEKGKMSCSLRDSKDVKFTM